MNRKQIGLTFILIWAIAGTLNYPVQAQIPDLTGKGRPCDRGSAASHAISPHPSVHSLQPEDTLFRSFPNLFPSNPNL